MSQVHKVRACNARIVETTPPHNYKPLTGKEPGVKCILVELGSRETTNLWPPQSGSGLKSPYTMGFALTKDQATELTAKLKELSESMEG